MTISNEDFAELKSRVAGAKKRSKLANPGSEAPDPTDSCADVAPSEAIGGGVAPNIPPGTATPLKAILKPRPTTDEDRLNKTERAWLRLMRDRGDRSIGIQCITLKLADDTRYTPDFSCLGADGDLLLYEVKGFMRDDARVKIKVAARQYHYFVFILVRREKAGGGWSEEIVKP